MKAIFVTSLLISIMARNNKNVVMRSKNLQKKNKKTETEAFTTKGTQTLTVEEGMFGTWGAWAVAPAGSFLCGYKFTSLDIEEKLTGNLGVDGLTAIFCDALDWTK